MPIFFSKPVCKSAGHGVDWHGGFIKIFPGTGEFCAGSSFLKLLWGCLPIICRTATCRRMTVVIITLKQTALSNDCQCDRCCAIGSHLYLAVHAIIPNRCTKKYLCFLAPVGKMAFANYIMHAMVGNLVF